MIGLGRVGDVHDARVGQRLLDVEHLGRVRVRVRARARVRARVRLRAFWMWSRVRVRLEHHVARLGALASRARQVLSAVGLGKWRRHIAGRSGPREM